MRSLLLLTLLALAAVSFVPAAQTSTSAAPSDLRGFLLRSDEVPTDTFSRTPSFAWAPYARAKTYDFELATSRSFDDSSVVWSTQGRQTRLTVPALAIPIALPWMTGRPYALYAHVRARTDSGVSRWSAPFGFNMRWQAVPQAIVPTIPGLVRWTPVEGATSYQVWFIGPDKVFTTTSNVADEREYYSFHSSDWSSRVLWRVRAVREVYGSLPKGLPVVSVGPWSDTFESLNPAVSTGPMTLLQSVSDTVSARPTANSHGLSPAFSFAGDASLNGTTGRLYRVYVFTDAQCVNTIFTGSVVGSPAYAPRTTGPLSLPTSPAAVTAAQLSYLSDGAQSGTYTADLRPLTTNETGGSGSAGASSAFVDLWDSGWPTGRYYWTAVPVREVATTNGVTYVDAEIPQDACAAGRVGEFGKLSVPGTASGAKPYASGLAPRGGLVAAKRRVPSFSRAALIAWTPAPGATSYEVQWSRTSYPWKTVSATPFYTAATSMLLDGLQPGTWFYRVRGIDPYVPGPAKELTWSAPAEIRLVKPTFSVKR